MALLDVSDRNHPRCFFHVLPRHSIVAPTIKTEVAVQLPFVFLFVSEELVLDIAAIAMLTGAALRTVPVVALSRTAFATMLGHVASPLVFAA